MTHHHAADVHLARELVHLHVGHPGRPGGAEAGELAVDVAGIGQALALEGDAVVTVLPGAHVGLPAGALGGFAQEFGRARVVQMLQAEGQRVFALGVRQLIHEALVGEGVRQGRHPAQPGGAQDGRHVVDRHLQVRHLVGRHRGAVAHGVGLRCGRHAAGEQQCQRGRGVAGVAGLEVPALQPPVGAHRAVHVHQLRGALGLPLVLLFARELHPHGPSHGARQQGGVCRHVIGAIAAVAAGGLQAHHVHGGVGQAGQQGQVGAQHVGVLSARPHAQTRRAWGARTCRGLVCGRGLPGAVG